MSHRSIMRDPVKARKQAYQSIESEQMEAIMEAFDLLSKQGMPLGGKMDTVLQRRAEIKQRNRK